MGRIITLKIHQMELLAALTVHLGTAGIGVRIAIVGSYAVRHVYRILVGKPEGKRPIGRPSRRWVDNIKI